MQNMPTHSRYRWESPLNTDSCVALLESISAEKIGPELLCL